MERKPTERPTNLEFLRILCMFMIVLVQGFATQM